MGIGDSLTCLFGQGVVHCVPDTEKGRFSFLEESPKGILLLEFRNA